ncbi:hypothetical protein F4778DRAFT_747241 [Xylariomycetidae sp. FL2044]|nr:hypothetical protein F4778DRAFT_747241 [Xylariomycetidae sp. FL2044]
MFSLLPLFSVLAALAVATPTSPTTPTCVPVIDDYEDHVFGPSSAFDQVGEYNGITYRPFIFIAASTLGSVQGLVPHSGRASVRSGLATDLTQAGGISLYPFGILGARPSSAFDLSSFYFGCVLNLEASNQAGVPLACTITVTGFTADNQAVPVATFGFTPTSALSSLMVLAQLPATYKRLKNVTIGVTDATLLPPLAALALDYVQHCNYA